MDVEIHISIYYNLLVSRLIETHFSDRPSTQEQKELILRLLGHQMAHPDTADMVWHALGILLPGRYTSRWLPSASCRAAPTSG
jgi:hypothetical protein